MPLARHNVKQFTYIIFLILIMTPWDTVTISILLMRLLRLKSRSDLPRTIKPVNGRTPAPKQPQAPILQLPLWDGVAPRPGGRHCPRQMFSLHPSCSGGAHCQEDQPASGSSAPSQPVCSTGAQSPIRSLLWAELGGMSKGRAEEWPQFKVQHPVPLTRKNPGC